MPTAAEDRSGQHTVQLQAVSVTNWMFRNQTSKFVCSVQHLRLKKTPTLTSLDLSLHFCTFLESTNPEATWQARLVCEAASVSGRQVRLPRRLDLVLGVLPGCTCKLWVSKSILRIPGGHAEEDAVRISAFVFKQFGYMQPMFWFKNTGLTRKQSVYHNP